MEPTGFAPGARHVFEYALSRGVDEAELLRRADLRGLSLRDPDARIPLRCYYNVIESIARIPRYYRVLNEGERLTLEHAGERAIVRFEPWGRVRPAHAYACEMVAFDFLVLVGRMTGEPVPILAFDVRHAKHGDDDVYMRVFGRVPRFGATENMWSFPAAVLARPMASADAALSRFFEGYVEKLDLRVATRSVANEVRSAIAERLCDGELTLTSLARGLKQSARTLQRRLADEGTAVSKLVESVRRERAFAYLAANLPIGEVSYLLDFSEPRAFHRAFRRWTGETPQAWRADPLPRARRE